MYNLPHYKAKDEAEVIAFMKEHPFITLIGTSADLQPVATQVPVLVDEKDGRIFLRGHIMRNNDHHLAFEKNKSVLALFTSPHTYVSASWYTNKQQGSTWNYMTVQAAGTLRFLSLEELVQLLADLTTHFEGNAASPASFEKIPQDYIDRMTKAIVAFEIEVTSLEHVFKLSQNRDQASFNEIVAQLGNGDGSAQFIAGEMKKRQSRFFADL